MSFDIEKEARKLIEETWGLYTEDYGPTGVADIVELLTRCRDETEEECIQDTCFRCRREETPILTKTGWWHEPDTINLVMCHAARIHERRRQREEGK